MARKFLTPIDLTKLEIQNVALQNLGSDPGTPATGQIYFNTGGTVKVYNGTSWLSLSTAGGTVTSVTGTSPVVSSGGTTPAISLATAYGDTLNPYGTKTNNYVLAGAASGGSTAPTFRALAASDIPNTLNSTTFSGTVSLGSTTGSDGYSITGLKNPSGNYDAVNKLYVDNVASGVNAHDAVAYATTGALGSSNNIPATSIVYNNGTSGVGATLTVSAPSGVWSSLSIDSQTVTVGDRVLIKDQGVGAADQNGVYTVTSVTATIGGSTGSVVFTRATDYNSTPNVSAGDFMFVTSGPVNGKFSFVQTSKPTAISGNGTTANAINFSVFSNGNLSSTVAVNQGGTGVQSLTSNGVILGNGTSAVNVTTAGAADTVLRVPSAGGAPAFGAIDVSKSAAVTGILAGANGGTGVANTGKTITISGNVTIGSSTDTVQFTTAGNTNVTLPTTGTLLTAASAVTSVNGSVGAVANIAVTNAANTFTGTQTVQAAATQDSVKVAGRAGGTSSYAVTLTPATLNGSVTLTLPSSQAAQGFTLARTLTGTVTVASGTGTITHNMNNQYVLVQIFDNSTNALVDMDVTLATANTVTVAATTDATYRYVIIG